MNPAEVDSAALWANAALAAQLFAIDPFGTGGLRVRARPSPQRDQLFAWVRQLLPSTAPLLRLPLHITDDRLLGGLSLAATLKAGRVIAERGVLAQADGGVLVAAMAERLEAHVIAHLCAALDRGEFSAERDGLSSTAPCRFGVLALDEGLDDEQVAQALRDRLGLVVDFTALDPRAKPSEEPAAAAVERARALLPRVTLGEPVLEALCQAAHALGIASLRGPLLACAAARAHAALQGRTVVDETDAAVAARLVLGPRATRLPPPEPEEDQADEQPNEQPPQPEDDQPEPPDDAPDDEPSNDDAGSSNAPLEDVVLEAAKAAIPAGLLELLALGKEPRSATKSAGHAGVVRASNQGGRPAGTRPGFPRQGERLNVVETLRAAAPWQALRRKERGLAAAPGNRRVEIRKEDFRLARFAQHTETSVIFCVDASGSAALQRLAEAKGAVEQVLADCYVRRDHVALIAFRGRSASLLLPSTRSLARVRKCLADLAGGGTTPLASGIDAALALAVDARKAGRTPVLVLMTDGRGNVARDGTEGSATAAVDALSSAKAVRSAGVRVLFLDTAPRPRPQSRALALEMGARYLPLPAVDAEGISLQVQSLAAGAS